MENYAELVCAFKLKDSTPEEVIDTLNFMTGHSVESVYFNPQPDHALFETLRWKRMLFNDSFHFPGYSHSEIKKEEGDWYVTIRCNLNNLDSEIEHFIDWVSPYILRDMPVAIDGEYQDKMFIGYYRYEGDEHPTLIYV